MYTPTIYYEKRGRRYVPVSAGMGSWSFRPGFHLIQVDKNFQSCTHNIDPNFAALLAATIILREALVDELVKAAAPLYPKTDSGAPVQLTDEQLAAWKNYVDSFGQPPGHARVLLGHSPYEIATVAAGRVLEKANEYMNQYPAVAAAWNELRTLINLTKDHDHDTE